jgi:hypothetical protein
MTCPRRRRARRVLLGALPALAATVLGATALAAQEPTWSQCDPRPGRRCGVRQLTRGEIAEIEALYNAPATRRERGPFTLARDSVVGGPLAVLGGPVRIAGRVDGAVLVLNGELTIEAGATIAGEVAVLGGTVTAAEGARTGRVRSEPDSIRYAVDEGRLALGRRDDEIVRLLGLRDPRTSASLRLAAVRTYNRVEGWPIEFGPRLRHRTSWGSIALDGFLVLRTGDRLEWRGENVGHDARLEARVGRERAFTLGARAFDVVAPVEDWQLSEVETGLASFLFTSDYRDYFERHGGAIEAGWQDGRAWRMGIALRQEHWHPRRTLDPLSLLRADEPWRPNPQFEEGDWRIGTLGLSYDTRSDPLRPRTGWWLQAQYEHGRVEQSVVLADGPAPPATGPTAPSAGPVDIGYGRLQLDLRRYTRLSPSSQLNARVFAAGWLHGDPLPLQRRLSLSGPGAMPGFDFRRQFTVPDRLQCGAPGLGLAGSPALCDRALLASVDYRHDIRWLVDLLDAPRFVRTDRAGAAGWVAFVDVGRGWLVNPRTPRVPVADAPGGLGAMHASVGVGLELYQGGVYIAKALGSPSPAPNVFLRLVRRF